jgi:subtilisin family serine protease
MIYRRALLAAAVTAGVVAPVTVSTPGAVAAPGALTPMGPTVTLLTGDKVTVGGPDGAKVRPGEGREHLAFHIRTDVEGDVHVIPQDAAVPLARGKLDPRLFDVTELARTGYDDASRDRLPLIVDYAGATPRAAGARVSRELPAMGAAAVSVERSTAYWDTAQQAERVWLDGPVRMSLDQSVPRIGAPEAWAAGHTGEGTTVAVLDTGIDVTHPDLADAVVGERNFTDSDTTDDRQGHGTHVASTITGNGAVHQGVAPEAKLLNGKVLDDYGSGLESWIIAGMEWAASSGADVVNLSLGSRSPSDGADPMSQALNRITAETGALFVVAAGNDGPAAGTIGSPGAADAALTVGAVDRNDRLADFSGRGPRMRDGAVKPEITAPGVGIVAAKAENGYLGTPAGDGYVALSGTSMATPHVAGAAAVLAGRHPDWTAEQLKAGLVGSARPDGTSTVAEQGAGRVDVAAATTAAVSASPASINNGIAQWPHDDDQPITTTLTYTSTGTGPVTLDLTTSGAPFTVEPSRLTVPAGGRASATVTTDTRTGSDERVYSGLIVASGAGQSVRTPISVNREPESYDVTMRFVGFDGQPTDFFTARLVDVDKPGEIPLYDSSGTVKMRLPKGEYYFDATVLLPIPELRDFRTAEFVEPALTLTGDVELVFDAREAKPVGFDLDNPNVKPGNGKVVFQRTTAWGGIRATQYLMSIGGPEMGAVKPAATRSDAFTFTVEERLAERNGESFTGSSLYHVRHTEKGTVPETLRWRYRDRQFAKVRSEHAVATPGTTGFREWFLPLALPGTLTEYYTPDVPWDGEFTVLTEPSGEVLSSAYQVEPRSFPLGRTTAERWNVGVFGPSLPLGLHGPADFAARIGDRFSVSLPLATDQGRGRMNFGYGVEGTTTLLRDGEVIGEHPYDGRGWFDTVPERAEYTLRTTTSRPSDRLSTAISAEWAFTSEHSGEEAVALPLPAVRFAPDLDDRNAAPAGKSFTIPLYVQRNGGGEVGTVSKPVVEVSYDDGATWRPATVKRDRGGWRATVHHPAGAEFVSLRSSVTDPDGNSQRQTITRAYALE